MDRLVEKRAPTDEIPGIGLLGGDQARSDWSLVRLDHIEDLRDAVLGAGLAAVQMSNEPVSGGLAFAERRGIVFTCGSLGGTVGLSGALSEKRVTLGLGLRIAPGSWHWHAPIGTGSLGIWRPGDDHDSLYRPGALYTTVNLSLDQLEAEAAKHELVLDDATLGGTRFVRERIPAQLLASLRDDMDRVHRGQRAEVDPCEMILTRMIEHCARKPYRTAGPRAAPRHARIVSLARDYINSNLHRPISVEDIAAAAITSQRTLYRAFVELLGESPKSHVRRLRLHRIRHDLVSQDEAACTIAMMAHEWGIGEPGRFAVWYRDLFGELPSQTLARRSTIADAAT